MAEVTSNIWGTRFKIVGVAPYLPTNLGQVNYKTSLLHLQPRQMAIVITELRDDLKPEKDPNFQFKPFSDEEEETTVTGEHIDEQGRASGASFLKQNTQNSL